MWRKLPVIILFAAVIPACTTISRTPGPAQLDHELFYAIDTNPVNLEIPLSGATFSNGSIDATVYRRLAAAWEAGEKPSYPLIGREPALWLRELEVTPVLGSGGKVHLEAKALAPYPVRLTLLAMEGGHPATLSQTNSEAWSAGSHFGAVSADYAAFTGTIIIVRVEGAHQAMESWVRLMPSD
ncbi:MAG: hypothetical protein QM477_10310 [Planctomycetota bacterium]